MHGTDANEIVIPAAKPMRDNAGRGKQRFVLISTGTCQRSDTLRDGSEIDCETCVAASSMRFNRLMACAHGGSWHDGISLVIKRRE